jgi:hypothetical protein
MEDRGLISKSELIYCNYNATWILQTNPNTGTFRLSNHLDYWTSNKLKFFHKIIHSVQPMTRTCGPSATCPAQGK